MEAARRLQKTIHFFLFTAMIGPAISYSKLYLFHFALMYLVFLYLLYINRNLKLNLQNQRTSYFTVLKIMILWYFLSIFWSINILYSFRYLGYLILGVSIVYFIFKWCSTIKRYKRVLNIIKIVFIIQLIVCLLEMFTSFRLPTSPYSPYAALLGKNASDLSEYSVKTVSFISTMPTGFLGNPNNLAIVIVTGFSFFLFCKRTFFVWLTYISLFLIILYSGSRGAFIGLLAGLFFFLLLTNRKKLVFVVIIVSMFSSIIVANIDSLKNSQFSRVADLANVGQTLVDYFTQKKNTGGSISERRQLIKNGMDALWKSNGLGVGGGGSQAVQEAKGGEVAKLASMHNFWIEILVDAGVVFFCIYAIWYICLFVQMVRIYRSSNDAYLKKQAGSLAVALWIFAISCISASSVVYLLQMWILFGLSISIYLISKKKYVYESIDVV